MQSLWFRAAQTRSSCRCNACVKIGTIITRQTTNAIGKLADSNRKVRRREQWDRVIAEAKAGVPTDKVEESQDRRAEENASEVRKQIPGMPEGPEASGTSGTSRLPGYLGNQSSFPRTGIVGTKAGSTGPMTWDGVNWTANSSMSRLGIQLNSIPLNVSRPAETKAPESSQDLVPQSTSSPVQPATPENIADLEQFGEYIPSNAMLQPRKIKTRKHLDRLENSISKLVHRLMWTTKLSPIAADLHSASSGIFLQTDKMIGRVEELQRGDISMPAYKLEAEVGQERFYLHDALENLLKNTSPGQDNLNLILAKICYNLLISSASPNIFTYNFLIEKLTELMLHDHAQVIVDSFLYDTMFKPTSRTIQVILNHYAAKNDLEGYRSIIRRMRAVDGSWLERKVPRDESIFDALIGTSLQMTTARQSVMYIRAALRQDKKIKIRPELLCEAVRRCVAQLDHSAGASLLHSILETWAENIEVPDRIPLTKTTRWAIRELMYLCGIDPTKDLPQILPVDIPRWNLGRLLFWLNLGSIRDSVERFVARINSLQDILQISPKRSDHDIKKESHLNFPEFGNAQAWDYLPTKRARNRPSSQSNIDRSLEIFEKFSYTENARAEKSRLGARQGRRVMLQSLESEVALSKANILSTEMSLVSFYYNQFPRDWRYTYHLRLQESPHMSLGHRIVVLKGLKRLQKLHVFEYQINLSLRQINLLKKELYYIMKERDQRMMDLITKSIKSKAEFLRLKESREVNQRINLLELAINTNKRHVELLERDLNLDFPQVNPEWKLRELNLVLFKVNKGKHQVKLLAEEIYLTYPPQVARKTYIGSNRDWKVLRKFRTKLSFHYDPQSTNSC
ncbi:pentatricopeptide repeat domain-containing protein [Botrytis cinerea]